MQFALINEELVEPKSGLIGTCRGCGHPVIAKCGSVRVHHWAHQRTRMCDNWWEAEKEWHRSWKNNYPRLWQECFLPDVLTGEKHIADVRTDHGLVIEFQHSHLKPQERIARENFYQNMIWVVDCTRLTHDYPRFVKGQKHIRVTDQPGMYNVYDPDNCFPAAWVNCSVPVIFDFKGVQTLNDPWDLRNALYCLFPLRIGRRATLARISRSAFITTTTNGEWSVRTANLNHKLLQAQQEWQNDLEIANLKRHLEVIRMRRLRHGPGYGKGRRL